MSKPTYMALCSPVEYYDFIDCYDGELQKDVMPSDNCAETSWTDGKLKGNFKSVALEMGVEDVTQNLYFIRKELQL